MPYDLIYKERVKKGNLRADYDVILMPTQTATRQAVFQPPAARPVPYMKNDEVQVPRRCTASRRTSPAAWAGKASTRSRSSSNAGGTLIAMGDAVRFPTEFGFARSVDASASTTPRFYAPRPLVNAEVAAPRAPGVLRLHRADHADQVPRRSAAVGGDARPGQRAGPLRRRRRRGAERPDEGADEIRQRPFAVDVPGGYNGKGRVVLFANNPIYRWQNHGEFNMVFNALLNWNDLGTPAAPGAHARPRATRAARQ